MPFLYTPTTAFGTFTQPACGFCTGTITITSSNGNYPGSYKYSITGLEADYQTSNVFTGLSVGTYTIKVA